MKKYVLVWLLMFSGLISMSYSVHAKTPYDDVLSGLTIENKDEKVVAWEPDYALYDLDKNGVDELLLSDYFGDHRHLAAVWTMVDGQPVEIERSPWFTQELNRSGTYRGGLYLTTDGEIIHHTFSGGTGLGMRLIYQLREDNSGIEQRKEEFDASKEGGYQGAASPLGDSGRQELDWKQLNWTSLNNKKEKKSKQDSSLVKYKGAFLVGERTLQVYNSPDASTKSVSYYESGDQILFDEFIGLKNDHFWISYLSKTGVRRYVPIYQIKPGVFTGGLPSYWGFMVELDTNEFSTWGSHPYRRGNFYPNKEITIRNSPQISAPAISGPGPNYYESGDTVEFDQVGFSDDQHLWGKLETLF